ncbi:MAG: hypothetical protein JJ714_06735 [Acidithiobacillus sp.]|nr:hypothetical protein [Acidithiobacillus sp.]
MIGLEFAHTLIAMDTRAEHRRQRLAIPEKIDWDTYPQFLPQVKDIVTKISGTISSIIGLCKPLSNPSDLMAFYHSSYDAIDRLAAASTNWSVRPAQAPNIDQIYAARLGLLRLWISNAPEPKIMLLDEGTLGAFWWDGEIYASMDFNTDGEYPWSVANGLNVISGIWAEGEPMPNELRNAIGIGV